MTKQYPEYTPRRINNYVPAMGYAADVNFGGGQCKVNFGTPAAADTDGAIDGGTIGTSAVVLTTFNGVIGDTADAEYGRNVTCVGGTAGDNAVVTVNGRDYWGQPMVETFTLSGASGQTGAKAFKYIDSVEVAANAQASTIDVGWGAQLGLPYKAVQVVSEISDGTPEASLGTLTAPVLTDPQTASTGDPRGTYAPNVTLTGSVEVEAIIVTDNRVNSDGNGGLLGIKHYYA